jgi:predicted RNase H-like HicB family nuclease
MTTFIALIHKEANSDYGVSFPDLPGCVTAASTIDEVISMAKEALSLHIEGMLEEGEEIPVPTDADSVNRDGALLIAAVDVPDNLRVERVNVTVPAITLARIDSFAEQRGMTRSALFVEAVQRWIAEERSEPSRGSLRLPVAVAADELPVAADEFTSETERKRFEVPFSGLNYRATANPEFLSVGHRVSSFASALNGLNFGAAHSESWPVAYQEVLRTHLRKEWHDITIENPTFKRLKRQAKEDIERLSEVEISRVLRAFRARLREEWHPEIEDSIAEVEHMLAAKSENRSAKKSETTKGRLDTKR